MDIREYLANVLSPENFQKIGDYGLDALSPVTDILGIDPRKVGDTEAIKNIIGQTATAGLGSKIFGGGKAGLAALGIDVGTDALTRQLEPTTAIAQEVTPQAMPVTNEIYQKPSQMSAQDAIRQALDTNGVITMGAGKEFNPSVSYDKNYGFSRSEPMIAPTGYETKREKLRRVEHERDLQKQQWENLPKLSESLAVLETASNQRVDAQLTNWKKRFKDANSGNEPTFEQEMKVRNALSDIETQRNQAMLNMGGNGNLSALGVNQGNQGASYNQKMLDILNLPEAPESSGLGTKTLGGAAAIALLLGGWKGRQGIGKAAKYAVGKAAPLGEKLGSLFKGKGAKMSKEEIEAIRMNLETMGVSPEQIAIRLAKLGK